MTAILLKRKGKMPVKMPTVVLTGYGTDQVPSPPASPYDEAKFVTGYGELGGGHVVKDPLTKAPKHIPNIITNYSRIGAKLEPATPWAPRGYSERPVHLDPADLIGGHNPVRKTAYKEKEA